MAIQKSDEVKAIDAASAGGIKVLQDSKTIAADVMLLGGTVSAGVVKADTILLGRLAKGQLPLAFHLINITAAATNAIVLSTTPTFAAVIALSVATVKQIADGGLYIGFFFDGATMAASPDRRVYVTFAQT